MKFTEFKDMDEAQLKEQETALRRRLFDLRTQAATDKVKDVSQFQKTKKDIARVLTALRQRQQGATKA